MNKNWKKTVCVSEVNGKEKFLKGHCYFGKESDDGNMMICIDEEGKTVNFSKEAYQRIFCENGKKFNHKEIIKIQIVFGNSWVDLSRRELEMKKEIKKVLDRWLIYGKNTKFPAWVDLEDPANDVDEAFFERKLSVCSKLSEAMNPDNWENLGAAEVGERIREFQETFG